MVRPILLFAAVSLAACQPPANSPATHPSGAASPQVAGAAGGAAAIAIDPGVPDIPAAGVHTETSEGWERWQDLVPYQKWHPVPGRGVGLLMSAGAQPWGGSINWAHGIHTRTERTEYQFFHDRSSAVAVYFVSDGPGYNRLLDWAVPLPRGGVARFDAAMFSRDTQNPWGLRKLAHLVEFEANRGAGGGGNVHFVITDARVVDGTDAYPIDPERALMALRRRFDAAIAAYRGDIDTFLARERARARGMTVDQPGTLQVAIWPTWIEAEATLEVVFVRLFSEVAYGEPVEGWTTCPPCPCTPQGCAPCARCEPRRKVERPQHRYGYQFAVRYEVDRTGALVHETIYRPIPRW